MEFHNLVCEGGGVKALAFVGALKCLQEVPDFSDRINHFAGSSAGALTVALIACGYQATELESALIAMDFKDKIDGNILNNVWTTGIYRLWNKYGLFPMDELITWVDGLIAAKLGKPNATFQDLYKHNGHTLVVTTTSVRHAKTLYYSREHHPDMVISEALKRSMSIPLFFEANFVDQEDVLVDGGMLSNYPIWLFDRRNPETGKLEPNPHTLGLKLMEITEQPDSQLFHGSLDVDSLPKYLVSLVECLLIQIERLHVRSDYWERTIPISIGDVQSTDFALSAEQKQDLIDKGYECTKQWLHSHELIN
jgi:NTE family protein